MTCIKTIISILLIAGCSFHAGAQQKEEYLYRDSSIQLEGETPAEEPVDEEIKDSNIENEKTVIDTVLRINHLPLSADSIRSLRNSKPFAYARNLDSLLKAFQKEAAIQADTRPAGSSWLDKFFTSRITIAILWILAGAFIAFILYQLFFTQGFFQRQSGRNRITHLAEEMEGLPDITDHDQLISRAIVNKDYRLAVRYCYLQTLQKLAAAGLIHFAADKTNHQYVTELYNKPCAKDFSTLTLNYEYIWYGEFEINEGGFLDIQQKFKQFNNQV